MCRSKSSRKGKWLRYAMAMEIMDSVFFCLLRQIVGGHFISAAAYPRSSYVVETMYRRSSDSHRLAFESRQLQPRCSHLDFTRYFAEREYRVISNGPKFEHFQITMCIRQWDPDVKYSNSIQIVDGGYEMFMLSYPMITSNPKFKPEISIVESYESIDDIEYPSLSDIKMRKDTPLKDVTNRSRPSIDRSSKLAAEKTYKDKWKTPEEIIKEKEQLIDRALQKEKEALKLEADLEQTMREEPNEDETKRREWYEKQTELQYKIMQYDNERDDNVSNWRRFYVNSTVSNVDRSAHVKVIAPEINQFLGKLEFML